MEDMSIEFGDMLRETLDKMSERIEMTKNGWDGEGGQNVGDKKRLEEFTVAADNS